MHATQSSHSSLRSLPPNRRVDTPPRHRRSRQAQRKPHQAIALELSAKLVINIFLGVAALSTLVKLLPYNGSQQARLQELNAEVLLVEGRVAQLQADFNRHFDPRQSMSIMQEQSNRVAPGQRQVVWTAPPEFTQTP